jgi:DnaJ family protein B protein 12
MESNKDEALRCLTIAQRHRDAGNLPSARKFCQKSITLFSTPEAEKLLDSIDRVDPSSSGPEPSTSNGNGNSKPFSSSTETHPSAAGAKHRHTASSGNGGTAGGSGGEKREYTPEQHGVVKRVRACKVTEYYEILSVKRDCDEGDVKKAYRKVCSFQMFYMYFIEYWNSVQLALALHPDKNGAPNADEAFKSEPRPTIILTELTPLYSGIQSIPSIIRQVYSPQKQFLSPY